MCLHARREDALINVSLLWLRLLRRQKIPLFAIHGDVDELVPLEANSGALCSKVRAAGGKMNLIVAAGQGHNMWDGFFQCEELVQFVIEHAQQT